MESPSINPYTIVSAYLSYVEEARWEQAPGFRMGDAERTLRDELDPLVWRFLFAAEARWADDHKPIRRPSSPPTPAPLLQFSYPEKP